PMAGHVVVASGAALRPETDGAGKVARPQRGGGQRAVGRPVEAVGVAEVFSGPPVAVGLRTGRVAHMAHDCPWLEAHRPARPPGPPAPLEILDVHEIALVEAAELVERVAAKQERGPHGPVDLARLVVAPGALEQEVAGPAS